MAEMKKREATLENGGIDVESRRVRFTFMTEAPCENWFVPEVCLCRKENADLTRFKNGVAPCLFNHNRDIVIAKIDKLFSEDNRYKAEVIFDKDEQSETIFQKCISGSLRGVSVGYIPKEVKRVKAGETYKGVKYERETDVVTKWELLEVSIVSIPADSDSGVGRTLSTDIQPQNNVQEKENKKMSEVKDTQNTLDPKTVEEQKQAYASQAVEAEKKRCAEIMALCRKHSVDNDAMGKYIAEGKSLTDVTASILEIKAEKEKAVPTNVEIGATSAQKVREAMVTGLGARYGLCEAKDDKYSHVSIRDIMVECLEREGNKDARYMRDDEVISKARAMGSGQFLGVIEDFANMAKAKAIKEQPFIYRNFVSRGYNKDFKANHVYELSLAGDPVLMTHESGEFKHQTMSDAKVTTSLKTYGKAIAFTREIFINDQLGQVAEAIARQAIGFERLKEKMFFQTLAGITYNTTTNKNLVSVKKDISADAYDEMYQLMMNQKDIGSNGFIGVPPRFLIAPVGQRIAHKVLLQSSALPNQNNAGVINPVQNDMLLFTTPYLTGTAYYAVASPAQMAGIEYTTLVGAEGVQSRIVLSQSYLSIEYQMWEDFGFNVLSHRAFVKNPNDAQ